MERFYVANDTGVPVHVRLDPTEAPKTFRLTFSKARIDKGRALANFVLITKTHWHLSYLDGKDTKFVLDNRMLVAYENYLDDAGDYILRITGFLN